MLPVIGGATFPNFDFFKTTKTKFSKLQDQKWHVDDRILQGQLSQTSTFSKLPRPNFQNYKTKSGTWTTEFCRGNFPTLRLFSKLPRPNVQNYKTKRGTWTTEFCRGNFPKLRLFQNYQDQKWHVNDRILQGELSQIST